MGVYAELTAQHVDDAGHGGTGSAGLTWQLTPHVQLDIRAHHRLSGHADSWQGGVGFAVYFGG